MNDLNDALLARLMAQAEGRGVDLVTLRALVEEASQAGAITFSSFGESRPIVATEDGVREAQNRRVEISLVP